MSIITMRRGLNLLELSEGGAPLPFDLQEELKKHLTYTHTYQVRGPDAIHPVTGDYRPTRHETKVLYTLDGRGRFCCSLGWKAGLEKLVKSAGHTLDYVNLDTPHPRPNRYETNWDRIFEKMDLKDKQIEWLSAMEAHEFGMVDVPPGAGKTFTLAAYAMSHTKARIHIITTGTDILRRIYNHLVKYLPDVGFIGAGKNRWGRVTCISADSLHKVAEGYDDPNSPQAADVVIFDEVHRAGATTYLQQLARYKHCRMYGFSGSIKGRFDGAERQLEGLFGEVIFSMTYQEVEALSMVVPVMVEWIRVRMDRDPIRDVVAQVAKERHGIWRNQVRNQLIAEKVLEFSDDTQVLILVAKLDHAVHLKQYLPEYRLCYAPSSKKDDDRYEGYVRAGLLDPVDEPKMTSYRREETRKAFEAGTLKKVIATDVWGTGVDFPCLQVLVRADGRASEILDTQLPGRVTRVHATKDYGLVIDCMDEWNDTFLRRSNVRKRNYIKKGWTMQGLGGRRLGTSAGSTSR